MEANKKALRLKINLILALGPNGELGSNNELPWDYIKEDMDFFKSMTTNKTIIMGKNTYLSIGKPLPNRQNIVVSKTLQDNRIEIASSLQEAISKSTKEIFIIGGASLYKEAVPFCDCVYLTQIPSRYINKKATVYLDQDIFKEKTSLNTIQHLTEEIKVIKMSYTEHPDFIYLDLLKKVKDNGLYKEDRTGTGTISLFGLSAQYDLQHSFPILTTKKVYWKGVIEELFWFLSGSTNANILKDKGVNIWNEWADENGELGPVYGAQWRSFGGVDQIKQVLLSLFETPDSRRHIVSAWNVSELDQMALPPCHMMFQFYVRENKYLDCLWFQRSADMFLGVPFNIASYALLTYIFANILDYQPGRLTHFIGDAHIYSNHLEQVNEQLSRLPRQGAKLIIRDKITLDQFLTDLNSVKNLIKLKDYDSHPTIKAPISV